MKKLSLIALFTVLLFGASMVSAQEIAYINVDELMSVYPEKIKADADLKALYDRHQAEVQKKQKALQDLENKAISETNGKSDAELQAMKSTLEGYQKQYQESAQSLKTYQEAATKELQDKEKALYTPINTKVQKAIDSAAAKKGIKYVLDSAALLYNNGGYNLLNDVKTELGIK